MKNEKPIIFSPDMVWEILAGEKTQTRRVIKPQLASDNFHGLEWFNPLCVNSNSDEYPGPVIFGIYGDGWHVKAPYVPGDILWVRERFLVRPEIWKTHHGPQPIKYYADTFTGEFDGYVSKPSIHMPRWAARVFLKVVDVQVERVQDITVNDALQEGVKRGFLDGGYWKKSDDPFYPALPAFINLWNRINEKRGYGWDKNPWVWAIKFQRDKLI